MFGRIDLYSNAELSSNTASSRKHPVMNVPALLFCYLICIYSIHESYLRIDVLFLATTLTDLLNTQNVMTVEAHWQMSASSMEGLEWVWHDLLQRTLSYYHCYRAERRVCKCRIYVFRTWVCMQEKGLNRSCFYKWMPPIMGWMQYVSKHTDHQT